MKKQFSTVIDETCILYDTIFISAGKIGLQIELSPDDLITLISGSTADLVFEENS
jgi:Cys-tRNA(Pro)/Cys-tRNA(Cys) deacylase